MKDFWTHMRRLPLIAVLLSVGACVPTKNASISGKVAAESDSMSISTVRVGPGATYNAEIYQGNYYSKYDPVVVNGTCKGGVSKVKVDDTPQAGATTTQTVNCSNGVFSWSKSLNTQTVYALVFTPQDSGGTSLSSPISKNYTYDTSNPAAPVFLTPSVTNDYTITNGATSTTITGQVLNEVVKLIGPSSVNIPLYADSDGIHKNFAYNANVPLSTTVNFTFTGYDAAGNSAAETMVIHSVLNLSIPVAAQELGGSHTTPGYLIIESTVGFMSETSVNDNVKHVTGSAGMMGNL